MERGLLTLLTAFLTLLERITWDMRIFSPLPGTGCSSGVVGLDVEEIEALDPGSCKELGCRRASRDRGLEPVVCKAIERRELGPGSKWRLI